MALVDPGMFYGAADIQPMSYVNPTVGSLIAAHLNTENTIGLVLNSVSEHWEPLRSFFYGPIDARLKEVEFNINSIDGTQYEPYKKDFLNLNTEAEALAKKQRIDRELEQHDIIARGGITQNLVASLVSGLVDPINWVTLGAASLPGIAARYGAKVALGTTARASLTAAASAVQTAAMSEAIAQGLSYERTAEESMVNITSSALLGGLFAGGATKATQTARSFWRNKAAAAFEKDMDDIAMGDTMRRPNEAPTKYGVEAGAHETQVSGPGGADNGAELGAQFKMTGTYPGWRSQSATTALKYFGRVTPGNRLAFSPSTVAQDAAQRLMTYGYSLDSNFNLGATNPTVHSNANLMKMVALNDLGSTILDTYTKVRKAGYKLSKDQLSQEMYAAYTNGFDHPISIVNDGLKKIYSTINEPMKNKAVAVGMFSDRIRTKFAKNYLTRIWDRAAIMADRPTYETLMRKGYIAERDRILKETSQFEVEIRAHDEALIPLRERIKELEPNAPNDVTTRKLLRKTRSQEKKLVKAIEKLQRRITRRRLHGSFTDAEIATMARTRTDEVLFGVDGNSENPLSRQDRRRLVPIENVDALPYLVRDFEVVNQMHIQKMSTDIALHEKFGSHEAFADTKIYQKIIDEYTALRKANPADDTKLARQQLSDLRDLSAVWDLMRGKFGKTVDNTADAWFKTAAMRLRAYGVITKLGGMAFSSVADIALGIHHVGIKRFMGTAVNGLLRTDGWKLAREEAKALGFIFDTELRNTLPRDLLSLTEQMDMTRLPDRMLRRGQGFVSKWSGSEKLESIRARLNTMLVQQEILRFAEAMAKGEATYNQKVLMASIGIDAERAAKFHVEQKKYGRIKDNFYLGGLDKWDPALKQQFTQSLQMGFDKLSLNPEVWEKPLFFSSNAGKLIGQWVSWAFTSYDKIVVAGLQRGDANTLLGILTQVGLAAMSEQLRAQWMHTREEQRPQDIDAVLSNAIMRSGILGHAGMMLERISAITGGMPAYYLAGRSVDSTRIAAPERVAIQLMGPTAGTLVDVLGAGSLAFEEGRNARNVRSLTKLFPFRNTQPFKFLYDQAEVGLMLAANVEVK